MVKYCFNRSRKNGLKLIENKVNLSFFFHKKNIYVTQFYPKEFS